MAPVCRTKSSRSNRYCVFYPVRNSVIVYCVFVYENDSVSRKSIGLVCAVSFVVVVCTEIF